MAFTPKQERFVAEYLIDGNATQSAKRAGYSEKTAEQQGHQLLKKTSVSAAIAKAQGERTERTNIDIDYVIQRLAVEAERESEGSSHSARVSALGQLRQHFQDQSGGGSDEVADALNKIADKLPG
jgi:phage terminase small subunit